MPALIEAFLDPASSTYSYVVYEADGGHCAIVDPVLDYDGAAGRTGTEQADRIIAFVRAHRLQVQWLLETHAHADHLSAAPYLRRELGGKIAIGESISKVQNVFKALFNLEPEFRIDGSQFDHLFAPNESFMIGNLKATALHVPGHTPADMAYVIDGEQILVGDTLFMPDVGTARCDFPGGNAQQLFRSIQKLLAFPASVKQHVRHRHTDHITKISLIAEGAHSEAADSEVAELFSQAEYVYPPTLFSKSNFQASCEGMAARDMKYFAGDIGQQTFFQGIYLILIAIMTGFLKLTSFCVRPK